eukprot:scaffold269549_cov40-Prasinocladus_malaysianus.AAC.1
MPLFACIALHFREDTPLCKCHGQHSRGRLGAGSSFWVMRKSQGQTAILQFMKTSVSSTPSPQPIEGRILFSLSLGSHELQPGCGPLKLSGPKHYCSGTKLVAAMKRVLLMTVMCLHTVGSLHFLYAACTHKPMLVSATPSALLKLILFAKVTIDPISRRFRWQKETVASRTVILPLAQTQEFNVANDSVMDNRRSHAWQAST